MRLLTTMLLLSTAIAGLMTAKKCLGQSPDDFLRGLIDEAPPHIRRLIDLGDVRFQIDDGKLQQVSRSALTEFQFQAEYRANYQTQESGDGRTSVAVRFAKTTFQMTHLVTLGTRFMGQADGWKSPLLLHEMDHVAITSDPRAKKLSLQVMFQPMSLQLDTRQLGADTNASIGGEVEKRVMQRREALQNLMQEGYRQLDERSNHGLEPIASRQEFFSELYCEPWLQALSFQYIDSCKKLVRGKTYQQTDHYRLLDLP